MTVRFLIGSRFGSAGYKPVVGDWTGTGTDKIGVELDGIWAIDYNGNYVWDGAVTDRFAGFGQSGDNPVVGDWDGTGRDKIGSEKDGFWAIDYNGNYAWDGEVTDRFAGSERLVIHRLSATGMATARTKSVWR